MNWYIRRSRDRFWRTSQDQDKQDAYDTLFTVLETLCRVAAPLLPLLTEAVWRPLTGGRSVHLTDWPDAAQLLDDPELVAAMETARAVCSAALSVRAAHNLRVRLPLASLTVVGPAAARLAPLVTLIAEEVNVKAVHLVDQLDQHAEMLLTVDPRKVGPRLGPATQQVLRAAREGRWTRQANGAVELAGHILKPEEYTLRLQPTDEDATAALPDQAGLVVLDLDVTDELQAEGQARDVVRLVQAARKEAGLQITDRIHLVLQLPGDVAQAVSAHQPWVQQETLARDLIVTDQPISSAHRGELPDGRTLHIGLHAVSG